MMDTKIDQMTATREGSVRNDFVFVCKHLRKSVHFSFWARKFEKASSELA